MKIGILTHPLTNNYGCILQNYALHLVLRGMGHEPITMDYTMSMPYKTIFTSFVSRILKRIKGIHLPLRGWPTQKEQDIINQNTREFVKGHIAITKTVAIRNLDVFCNAGFDAIVVGSDQVWRGDRKYIEKFFLSDFQNMDIHKIAYAASFGVDCWSFSKKKTIECATLLKKFKGISVREDSALNLCKKNFGVDAEWVLDPTFLINREVYEQLVRAKYPQISSCKKMMVYVLDKSNGKKNIVSQVSKSLQLTPNEVMAKEKFSKVGSKGLSDCIFPSVEEWLKGIMEADFVVTDSFHGTVFSIIFNKPFLTMTNNSRGNSRLISLLGSLRLMDRLVGEDEVNIENVIKSSINYEETNALLSSWKNDSIRFIEKGLQ